jgi:hypothetical protein
VLGQITTTHLARLGDEAKAAFKAAQREHRVKNPPMKVSKKKEEKDGNDDKVCLTHSLCTGLLTFYEQDDTVNKIIL